MLETLPRAPVPATPIPRSTPFAALRYHDHLAKAADSAFAGIAELAVRDSGATIAIVVLDRNGEDRTAAVHGCDPDIVPDIWSDGAADDFRAAITDAQPGRAVRFRIAMPIVDVDGESLGTLRLYWVVADESVQLNPDQERRLELLVAQASHLAQQQHTAALLAAGLERLRRADDLVPMCSHCHDVRNDDDQWMRVEHYLGQISGARVSHGICPECFLEHYPTAAADGA